VGSGGTIGARMSSNPFAAVLATPAPPGSAEAGWQAAATLYHAYFTGLILTLASRKSPAAAGEWIFRVFRRQHEEKFLASFDKLGLAGLPHAVAAARYHYLSNSIGGVEVEYMEESDTKAWVRFCHPRWLYEGAALCAVPLEVSHGFLRGWYGHNGVSLGNPRLGFVCTSQDMTAQYGLAGYFLEHDHALAPEERVRFAPEEEPPPFDTARAPRLDPTAWPAARLRKAHRNYAMDYVRTGLPELIALLGPADGGALGNLAGQLIGRQYYRQVQATLGATGAGAGGFAAVLAALASAQDDRCEVRRDGAGVVVAQEGWALVRGRALPHPAVFDAWNGLWEGCLAAHDRTLALEVRRRPDEGDGRAEWRIGPRVL
jgi:hypothetical protein